MRGLAPDGSAEEAGSHRAAPRTPVVTIRVISIAARTAALVTTAWALISRADCVFASRTCRATNLLSYFTIQSNIAFVLVTSFLIVCTILGLRERTWLTTLRVIITSYLIISGVTFAILIETAGLSDLAFLVPTSSKVLHFVVPVYAVIDFLVLPGRRRLALRLSLWALVYPFAYTVLTAVRGRALNWYPYVFFDPAWVGSYAGVVAYSAVLAGALLTVTGLLTLATRLPVVSASDRR